MTIYINSARLSSISILLVLLSSGLKAQVNLTGTWVAYKSYPGQYAEIASKEAEKMIGEKIQLANINMELFGDTCKNVSYRARTTNADDYLYNGFRTTAKMIGLEMEEIEVVDIYCNNKRAEEFDFILVDERTVIFPWRGHFFWMKRK